MINIQKNFAAVQQRIRDSEKKFGRTSGSVALLAVSKGQPLEKILQAVHSGQLAFGENYLQEALIKIDALADKHIEWHFIGAIQSNKTKEIAKYFSWVHSVSNFKIAQRLNEQRPPHLPPLNICLEINVSHETTKSGMDMDKVVMLATQCAALSRLKLRGLMTVPAIKNTFLEQRAELHTLQSLFQMLRNQGFAIDTLSMGMSNDLEAAIAEGATIVRIGTAIFGSRRL